MGLGDLFEAIKKRWLMILILTLIVTIASAAVSFFVIKPKYEASTKVFIGKAEGDNQDYNQSDVIMYQTLMKTYSEVIKTKDLISRSLNRTSLKLEPVDLLDNLKVVTVENTQILQIKYKSEDPKEARTVIKEISDEFMKTSKELVPNGNIKIIESVELPKKPVSPNIIMNIAIAFVSGIATTIGLAVLLELLSNTFNNKEQLERDLDIPVIGLIPTVKK